ncbi:MAG: hypothetical protein JO359_02400 [Candidatus Eremiobacteraeota bacterium]|nr:hypothetical protein [Candidatus Eremiobacteraeota bacterium]
MELITALTDKSLLQPDFEGDETRYRMLETTRAYAFGHLEALNERDATMRRLLAYLNGVLDKGLPADRESGLDSDLLRFLSTDLSTVTTVLRWACRSRDVADAAQLLRKIDTAWSYVGHAQEGITWVEAVAGMLPVDASRLRARLRTTLAFLYCNEARTQEGDLAATAAVESARSCGDAPTLLSALRARTVTLCSLGRHREAEDALEEAEALAGPHPPRFVRRTLLNARGVLASARGEPAAAVEAFRANVEIARGLGDPYEVMREVAFLAEALHAAGDTGSAIRETEAALYSAQTTLQMDAPAIVLANLAGYMLALDDVERGAQTATRALKTAMRPSGTQTELAAASLQLALACALSGDFASAARLFGFSVAAKDPIGSDTSHTEALTTERLKGILRDRFGDATLQSLAAEGFHFTEGRVSELMP